MPPKTWPYAPPINLLYRSGQRRVPRVKVFIDFLIALFARLEEEREPAQGGTLTPEKPHWYRRRRGRASRSPREAA